MTGVRGIAAQLNLRYVDTVRDRSYREEVPSGFPQHLTLFADADLDHAIRDLAYGNFAGYPLQIFSYDAVAYRDQPDQTKRSCVLFEVPARLPTVSVAPHNRLSAAGNRNLDPSSFEAKYRVITRDQAAANALLDEGVRSWLAGLDPPLRIEMNGRLLLAHVPLVAPEEIPQLVTTVFTLLLRIPDDALARFR